MHTVDDYDELFGRLPRHDRGLPQYRRSPKKSDFAGDFVQLITAMMTLALTGRRDQLGTSGRQQYTEACVTTSMQIHGPFFPS